MSYDITVEFTQLDHSGYTDAVGRMFASGDYPDVIIMGSELFKQYASTGILWDMADAYDNAEFQSCITLPAINENLKDKDGRLYAFSAGYGNGCITYIKQTWLDAVGIKVEDIKTYEDFYNMLLAFKNGDPDGNGVNGDTYGFISAGFLGNEAPYINYTAEFWQDSYPALLQDENGVWYDGFQTEATKQAREKFWSNDQNGSAGVFSYWAGSWYENIYNNLQKNEVYTELAQLAPIAEVAATGGYINREAGGWCIIDDGDGNNDREQEIWDALFETRLDGDKIQTLWTHGVEDVHWSTKAETITNGTGEKQKTKEYKEGEAHYRNSFADPTALFGKNNIDLALVISPLTNGLNTISDMASVSNKFFTDNCYDAPVAPACETYTNESGNIHDAKMQVISDVVVAGGDVDAAMAKYVETVGAAVEQCLAELNAR